MGRSVIHDNGVNGKTLCGLEQSKVIHVATSFRQKAESDELLARFGALITCKNCLRTRSNELH